MSGGIDDGFSETGKTIIYKKARNLNQNVEKTSRLNQKTISGAKFTLEAKLLFLMVKNSKDSEAVLSEPEFAKINDKERRLAIKIIHDQIYITAQEHKISNEG